MNRDFAFEKRPVLITWLDKWITVAMQAECAGTEKSTVRMAGNGHCSNREELAGAWHPLCCQALAVWMQSLTSRVSHLPRSEKSQNPG